MVRFFFQLVFSPLRFFIFSYYRLRTLNHKLFITLNLHDSYTEEPLSYGIWAYLKPAKDRFYLLAIDLYDLLGGLRTGKIKKAALKVVIGHHNLGWAQAWELRSLLTQLAEHKVEIRCYLKAEDKISLYIASACAHITVPPTAALDFSPFTQQSIYVQSFLTKLGIRPQFLSVGDFKSAAEIFTRTSMSKEARQQTEALIESIESEFFDKVARRVTDKKIRKKFPQIVGANTALEIGLIHAVAGFSDFEHALEQDFTKYKEMDIAEIPKYRYRTDYKVLSLRRPKKITLLMAEGNIVETETSRPGSINWPDYRDTIKAIKDSHTNGLIVRINSPGGSATVSQMLWHELMISTGRKKLPENESSAKKQKKHVAALLPVIVSQGNVAASGGYYLSAISDTIFSTPLSITGSIGVVGGKFNVAPLLKKWGIDIDKAPKKGEEKIYSIMSDFTPAQKKEMQSHMLEVYKVFVSDIATGRNVDQKSITPHAGGRVFSGRDAKRIGLINEWGGLTHAIDQMRQKLKLRDKDVVRLEIIPHIKQGLFNRSALPLGLRSLLMLEYFSKHRVYTADFRFMH